MAIEKWALPFFKKAGLQPATASTAACTDIQQQIDAADTWACLACAGFNNAQKIDRECQSREELTKVTWVPSWEPEETKEIWPKFQQRLLE
eukprot:1147292-Pelagomonas_calceolata.AAC.2